jgi:phenylpropionate dioxygenase-like ring-hydroxylating dioxygenase large terminal subunit
LDYVQNRWYPLTWSRDVGRSLIKRKIVGENVVLYRTLDGNVVALRDACPHRLAPLSFGKLKGDAIECGYHGMTFGGDGTCIRIPGQEIIPGNARVRAYPTAERMGLVWIWMADAALADPALIYHLPQHDDPRWSTAYGDALEIKTNYLNLADNLCDPAHVSFVHLSAGQRGERGYSGAAPPHRRRRPGLALDQERPTDSDFRQIRQFHRQRRSLALLSFHRAEHRDDRFRQRGHRRDHRRGRPRQGYADLRLPFHHAGGRDELHRPLASRSQFQPGRCRGGPAPARRFPCRLQRRQGNSGSLEQQEMAYPGFAKIRLGIDAAPMRMRRKVETMMEAERKISPPA